MAPACMDNHGPNISGTINALLATEYPFDMAVDFAVGQILSAVSIKKTR